MERLLNTEFKNHLVQAGRDVTNRTLRLLADREKAQPHSVFPVILYFLPVLPPDREFLWPGESPQAHREYQDRQARAHADRVQSPVWEFLRHNPKARNCFGDKSSFQLEPERHARSLPITNTMIVLANAKLAEALSRIENVVAVQRDLPLVPLSREEASSGARPPRLSPRNPHARNYEGFTWGWHRLGLSAIHVDDRKLTGKGVVVGLIDTGVCENHADLKFKVKDFVIVGPPAGLVTPSHAFDRHGHGTFTAGVLVGAANSGTQIGGAPDAELKAASLMSPSDWWTSFLSAAEWLSDPYRVARVINVSMGIDQVAAEDVALFELVIQGLLRHRTILVAAVGNRAGTCCYPARLRGVLGVGAFQPGDQACNFSGSEPDFLLPGSDVYSCVPGGLPDCGGVSYGYRDGTSFAAAHLSALIALLMQAYPSVPPWRIANALKLTAKIIGRDQDGWEWRIPQFERALEALGQNDWH